MRTSQLVTYTELRYIGFIVNLAGHASTLAMGCGRRLSAPQDNCNRQFVYFLPCRQTGFATGSRHVEVFKADNDGTWMRSARRTAETVQDNNTLRRASMRRRTGSSENLTSVEAHRGVSIRCYCEPPDYAFALLRQCWIERADTCVGWSCVHIHPITENGSNSREMRAPGMLSAGEICERLVVLKMDGMGNMGRGFTR
ncbi:hypothetical protein EDB87DRAFT_301240 [Lactarius vividus]|nr:hypothetical protein EDB87DRAFT_301240 [Lactarius vividus]